MKYVRARLIQTLVDDIDSTWSTSNFVAAIKEDVFDKGRWAVYLYPREGYAHQLIDLAGFVNGLTRIACDINYTMTEYNRAIEGEDLVQAIQIW